MKKYYLITDLVHNKDYLYWQYDNTDILGAVVGFARKQDVDIKDLRVYSFETKTKWEDYGRNNFHRIALWLCTCK